MANIIYDGDQQQTIGTVINGVHASLGPAALKAIAPSSSVYVFSKAFTVHFQGRQVTFRRGVPVTLHADLKAALLAVSAPMVAA